MVTVNLKVNSYIEALRFDAAYNDKTWVWKLQSSYSACDTKLTSLYNSLKLTYQTLSQMSMGSSNVLKEMAIELACETGEREGLYPKLMSL